MKTHTSNSVERDLVDGLGAFLKDLKSDEPLPDKYTCRRLVLDLKPRVYGPKDVSQTRELLKVSQALFAQFLGVSTKTVCGWEQGKPVSDIACRFMDEIHENPEYWRKRLREAATIKPRRDRNPNHCP